MTIEMTFEKHELLRLSASCTAEECACVCHVEGLLRRLRFKTLQRTATHCNTLQRTATHCNALQHTAMQLKNARVSAMWKGYCAASDVSQCSTLQHTVTHCNALQHTAMHCNTLQCSWRMRVCLPCGRVIVPPQTYYSATHCNALQHTATHCNTAQECACDHHVEGVLRRLRHATLDRRIGVLQCLVLCCSVLQCLWIFK